MHVKNQILIFNPVAHRMTKWKLIWILVNQNTTGLSNILLYFCLFRTPRCWWYPVSVTKDSENATRQSEQFHPTEASQIHGAKGSTSSHGLERCPATRPEVSQSNEWKSEWKEGKGLTWPWKVSSLFQLLVEILLVPGIGLESNKSCTDMEVTSQHDRNSVD